MAAEDRDAYEAFAMPASPAFALVSSLDGISLLRRNIAGLLDATDAKRQVLSDRGTIALGGLSDLPHHAILDRGRFVGLWEFDPDTRTIAWWSFVAKGKALSDAVARTEAFVRDDLGDARSFSLDSPKNRVPRIEALRKAASAQRRQTRLSS